MNLAKEMSKLPEPSNNSYPPLWDYWRHDLWIRAQKDNPANFTNWPCIYHTMLQNHWRGNIEQELLQIPESYRQYCGIANHLGDSFNAGYDFQNTYSLAMTHQVYHLYRWEQVTGLEIAELDSILEFGGGFGAMAQVCNRLGFKGDYLIYDLPEFSLLQQWYLSENEISNVKWLDNIRRADVNLVIASYSLSEVDLPFRDIFFQEVESDSYLLLYSNKFEDYDNIAYFQALDLGLEWRHIKLDHMPPESWYSFGY